MPHNSLAVLVCISALFFFALIIPQRRRRQLRDMLRVERQWEAEEEARRKDLEEAPRNEADSGLGNSREESNLRRN